MCGNQFTLMSEFFMQVLSRCNITMETVASAALSSITKECQARYSFCVLSLLEHHNQKEIQELEGDVIVMMLISFLYQGGKVGHWVANSQIWSGILWEQLFKLFFLSSSDVRYVKILMLGISTTRCIFLLQLFDNSYQKNEIILILTTLRRLLVDLRTSPFNEHRTFANYNFSHFRTCWWRTLKDSFFPFLWTGNWRMVETRLCLASEPILTSLALPGALHAFDEVTNSLNSDDHFGKDDMEFPKFNKLSSWSVLASGE